MIGDQAFSAFLVALFTEMCGLPLTIYVMAGAPKLISRRRPAVARRRAPAGACLRLEGQSALGAIPHPEQHIHLRRFLDAGRGVERALPGAARRAAGDNRALRPVASSAIRRLRSHSVRFPAAVADDFDACHVPGAGCMYAHLARREEQDMIARFGPEYRDYAARTPPFSPAGRRPAGYSTTKGAL